MMFSIITCVLNDEVGISSCMESVNSQQNGDYEHLIIDGLSTDGTYELAKSKANSRNRILQRPDNGLYDALNSAIPEAVGEYIIVLHSDDILSSDSALNELSNCIDNSGKPEVLSCDIRIVGERGKVIRKWQASRFRWLGTRFGWSPPHTGLVIRRDVYNKLLPYDLTFSISADYDFTLRLLSMVTNTMYLDFNLVDMKFGGLSTRPQNALLTLSQDWQIALNNRISPLAPILKRCTKLTQFM